MKENQLVSVCIPVYNGGLFIDETLRSIIRQTYKNIEIIISDNASTDNTCEIVCGLARDDARIKYYKNSSNIGYCKNILNAVNHASSEIIAIYHADDIYEPEIIEKQINILLNDTSVHGVFVKLLQFYSSKRMIKPQIYDELIHSSLMNSNGYICGGYTDYLPWILKIGNFFACPSLMTRKDIFIELGGFNDTYPTNEDLHLWIRYLENGFKLAIVNEFLLKYRINEAQGSSVSRNSAELAVMYKVIDEMIISRYDNLSDIERIYYSANKAKGYLFSGYNAYRLNDKVGMKKNFQLSRMHYLYPLFSAFGLAQRFPHTGCRFKKFMDSM